MALIFSPGKLRDMFGPQYSMIQTLPITVTLKETHSFNQEVTNKPVEDGSTISDNIILQPDQITINGIFADDSVVQEVLDIVSYGQKYSTSTWEDKMALLQTIRKTREPFDLVTSLGTYKNMFFSGALTFDRDATNATALFFTATLQNISIIQSRTTKVPAASTKDPLKQAPAKDKGKVSTTAGNTSASGKTLPAATNERSTSWLSSITGLGL